MKYIYITLIIIFIPTLAMYGNEFETREAAILKDSIIRVYELPKTTYRNLWVSNLDETVISIIKNIQPYVSDFNPRNIVPFLQLSSNDTICIFFEHPFDKISLDYQKQECFQGNYSWFVASTGMQYLYESRSDTIKVYPPFFSDGRGTPYNGFYRHIKNQENRKKNNRSACCLLVIIERRRIKYIEGCYY